MGVRITGLAEFGRKLERLPQVAREELRAGLHDNADRMVGLASALAPRDEGDLASSVRKEPGDHDLQVRVVAGGPKTTRPVREGVTAPGFDYAARAEFGGPDQAAHPYFWPSARALRRVMRARMRKAAREAVRKLFGGPG